MSLSRGRGNEREGKSSLLTLIGGLWCLRDIHSQLSTEGVHAHHPCMNRSVSKGWELVVVARDTVEGLCNVGSSLQDNLLESQRHIIVSCPDSYSQQPHPFVLSLWQILCSGPSGASHITFYITADVPVRSCFIILTTSQLGKLRPWQAESSLRILISLKMELRSRMPFVSVWNLLLLIYDSTVGFPFSFMHGNSRPENHVLWLPFREARFWGL